jgi:hypothetical protein
MIEGLHPAQQSVYDERRRFNALSAGRRWGKTTLALKLVEEMSTEGGSALLVVKSEMLEWMWNKMLDNLNPSVSIKPHHRLNFPSGGHVQLVSDRQVKAGIKGYAVNRIVWEEPAICESVEESWRLILRPMLSDTRGDGWFIGTPSGPSETFFTAIVLRGRSSADPDWMSWVMPTISNPMEDSGLIEEARKTLPREVFETEYEAKIEVAP